MIIWVIAGLDSSATLADEYLESLRESGLLDSSGAFSLDQQKARATLQRFQLPSADHYVLPLVACAVDGGADSLSYHRERRYRLVDLEGLAVGPESQLTVRAFLESALNTAGRDPGAKISGASWDGRRDYELKLEQGGLVFTPSRQAPWPNGSIKTRVLVTPSNLLPRRLLEAARWFAGVGPSSDRVASLVKAYSCYSPVPIRVQGRQINLERQGHWKQLAVLNRPPLKLRPQATLVQVTLTKEVPFAGYLGLGVGGGGALVIVDGLLYPMTLPDAPAEFRAILWHSGLRRDLSLLSLVENQELQDLRRQVSEILGEITKAAPARRKIGS